MASKLYERLKESIIELGEAESGSGEASREFIYEVDDSQIQPLVKTWAVCVKTDDEELLIPGKLYEIEIGRHRVLAHDEEGEATFFPEDFFIPVKLPAKITEKLTDIEKAA